MSGELNDAVEHLRTERQRLQRAARNLDRWTRAAFVMLSSTFMFMIVWSAIVADWLGFQAWLAFFLVYFWSGCVVILNGRRWRAIRCALSQHHWITEPAVIDGEFHIHTVCVRCKERIHFGIRPMLEQFPTPYGY